MTYLAPAEANAVHRWPQPPEEARFRYVGVLVGEQNFARSSPSQPGIAERLARWAIGLGGGRRRAVTQLVRPQTGMVDDRGVIYVTDAGRGSVFVFDEAQGKLDVWQRADQGESFVLPVGISRGEDGEVLVADAELGRVVRLTLDGKPTGSVGEGSLMRPAGIAYDARRGRIIVADALGHDIKVFDTGGELIDRIGRRGRAPGEFNAPTHLSFANDRLYVTDTLNARVQVLSADGEPLKIIGERGLYVGNLTRPKGVAVDSGQHVYVVESYYDHLLVFDDGGRYLLPIGGSGAGIGQFFLPAGVWTDARDRVFVADMHNARVVVLQFVGG